MFTRRSMLLAAAVTSCGAAFAAVPGVPAAHAAGDVHTGQAYDPASSYTMKWTRADAMKIMQTQNNPNVPPGANSLLPSLTMPAIPRNFPVMTDPNGKQVWVWDTWPLTDLQGNNVSYNGYNIIFSLVADPYAGYTFDDRHVHARIGYWYQPSDKPTSGWTYGGQVFAGRTPATQAEWSGSAKIGKNGQFQLFYTHMNFADRSKPKAVITLSNGRIRTDHPADGPALSITMGKDQPLLEPDGKWYQNVAQNPYYSFRDPAVFTDPANPGKTYMVFEGNTAGQRGAYQCQQSDLGASGENPAQVTASGANFQMANIGLAVATDRKLTSWKFLPPILSGNCVNDQTERPQFVIKNGKYYLFTISHAFTYAAGLRGPDGLYGFVGDGIRSDFKPLNTSGLAMGNPTDLNLSPTDPRQNGRQYQSYSHYVMPGDLVESFIDDVDGRRGGTLAPTVKLNISGATTSVNQQLLPYGYIPSNVAVGHPGK
ncbi:glycoside hydrolase family 68 protein [Flexivirga sp. ID2601S]|uniref:Glycoside hydrolase family 68 protein n=1 Tax=Flexivirga aerilata TaxID=1656889 RepID=A0A849AK48_9MICO|nr:glycoside hydrolase family 68 protein [Flexivirga aerilata]NNG39916.1 glycoside hydrolase family 68 protein [Flexivirga aerilata]